MHGLRKELLLAQTKEIGILSDIIELPEQPTMAFYEEKMLQTTNQLKKEGFTPVSYTHLRAHETKANLVCRLLLEKKK